MKITFYSNFLTHHQIPFSDEMQKLIGDGYKFVATEPMDIARIKMGWDVPDPHPYEIRSYENKKNYKDALDLGLSSDVVIVGAAPTTFVKERVKQNRLTFMYWERFFKKSAANPIRYTKMLMKHTIYRNKNVCLLCAGAYAAKDAAIIGAYPGKTYKWGYFTDTKRPDFEELYGKKEKETVTLLWSGRFLYWKHPEKAILLLKKLLENGYDCRLKMIGNGPMFRKINNLANKLHLTEKITFFGTLSPLQVREEMEKANIFIFTSDRQEGWGAVLNESMNSGCAVVGSKTIGSVPFLIDHEENGLIYSNDDIEDLYLNVEKLLKNEELRKKYGNNALLTTTTLWSPAVAAKRLVDFTSSLLNGEIINYEEGPCSRAY